MVLVLLPVKNSIYSAHLHWTFNLAIFEVAFPTSLWAKHRYFPLSVLFTVVIVNNLLSAEKLILLLLFTRFSSLNHESTGSGFPVALQVSVTFSPSVIVSFCGWVAISGRSKNFQKTHLYLIQTKAETCFKLKLFVEQGLNCLLPRNCSNRFLSTSN